MTTSKQAPTEFVALADRWRSAMGLSHQRFVTMLGRDKTEWSHYLAGRREPTETFVQAVLARAEEPWLSSLERAYSADALARVKPAVAVA